MNDIKTTIGAIGIAGAAFLAGTQIAPAAADTFTKIDDSTVQVTTTVNTSYDIGKIDEQIERFNILLAQLNNQCATGVNNYQNKIQALSDIKTKAADVGVK